MDPVAVGESYTALPALVVDDEDLAGRSVARLLITASTTDAVERLARRVHAAGLRAGFPFVHTSACDLPVVLAALSEQCSGLLDDAAGGSLLISGVEAMPPAVQAALIDLLTALESARYSSAGVRLIFGTTESLLARVAAGTFSERLFYQLNSIHLIAEDRLAPSHDCAA